MNEAKPPVIKRVRLNKAKLIALIYQTQKMESKLDQLTKIYYAVHKR